MPDFLPFLHEKEFKPGLSDVAFWNINSYVW